MSVAALWLLVVAPLPYWALGLPWMSADRVRLAPLVGCALAGLYAEWAMIAGLPVLPAIGIAVVASAAVVVYRWRRLGDATEAILEWLPVYWVSVLAASLSPFPVLGSWSGDWLILYQMGEAVIAGDLPRTMLTRPPLFGASTAPLWLLQSGLIPYQLMAAVASAAAVTATFHFMRFLRPNASRLLLVPLMLSPFFLHHTAAAWSKMLAGALVLAALVEAFRSQRVAGALLFALAVAVHEGFIIWAPCLLLCYAAGPERWRGLLKASMPMAAAGVLIVGPLVAWILWKYGLDAKVVANPAVTDTIPMPLPQKTALGILASFIGWGPFEVVARWAGHADATASGTIAKEGYWLITSWNTTVAATMAGFLLPFVGALREIRRTPRPGALPGLGAWATVGLTIVIVLNSALAGFYSSEGMTQAALVPLVLGVYAVLATQLAPLGNDALAPLRRVALLTIVVGTLPWLLLNAGTSAGLWLSEAMRQRFLSGSEGDYFRVVDNGLQPLGMAAFPAVPCFCVVLLITSLAVWRKFSRSPEPVSASLQR